MVDDNNDDYSDDDSDNDDQFLTNNPDDINPMAKMKEGLELPEDHDTPFSPPDELQDRIDNTNQQLDAEPDEHERYDAGLEAASGVDLPSKVTDEDQNLST